VEVAVGIMEVRQMVVLVEEQEQVAVVTWEDVLPRLPSSLQPVLLPLPTTRLILGTLQALLSEAQETPRQPRIRTAMAAMA